jgi:hypothetical protein
MRRDYPLTVRIEDSHELLQPTLTESAGPLRLDRPSCCSEWRFQLMEPASISCKGLVDGFEVANHRCKLKICFQSRTCATLTSKHRSAGSIALEPRRISKTSLRREDHSVMLVYMSDYLLLSRRGVGSPCRSQTLHLFRLATRAWRGQHSWIPVRGRKLVRPGFPKAL